MVIAPHKVVVLRKGHGKQVARVRLRRADRRRVWNRRPIDVVTHSGQLPPQIGHPPVPLAVDDQLRNKDKLRLPRTGNVLFIDAQLKTKRVQLRKVEVTVNGGVQGLGHRAVGGFDAEAQREWGIIFLRLCGLA